MKVYKVTDPEFSEFGKVLEGYDYTELFSALKDTPCPEDGVIYVGSVKELESTSVAKDMQSRGFGHYPLQLGYVNGRCRRLNCLEYHKSCEFNIAMDDVILILGREQDIKNGEYDTSLCKAFLIPAGMGVEIYSTTLHYAPFSVSESGYRVVVVLPRGTNMPKEDIEVKTIEDRMYFGKNKWLLAHPDAPEVNDGAQVGVTNTNIGFEHLEL